MKTKHLVTRESLQALLDREDPAFVTQVVGRALVVLLKRQTDSEAQCNTVSVDNGIGFTGADGRSGCITAKTYIKRGTLDQWQIDRWTKKGKNGFYRLTKYWRQLDAEAKHKAALQ